MVFHEYLRNLEEIITLLSKICVYVGIKEFVVHCKFLIPSTFRFRVFQNKNITVDVVCTDTPNLYQMTINSVILKNCGSMPRDACVACDT